MKLEKISRLIASILAPLLAVGCRGWEFWEPEGADSSGAPYQLQILSSAPCPLPPGLNPEVVTIRSYRVRLRASDASGVPANYFYASVLTKDGSRYLASYEGCAPVLSLDPLGSLEEAEGYLNFPMPPSKIPDALVYAPELLSRTENESTVTLSLGSARNDVSKDLP